MVIITLLIIVDWHLNLPFIGSKRDKKLNRLKRDKSEVNSSLMYVRYPFHQLFSNVQLNKCRVYSQTC